MTGIDPELKPVIDSPETLAVIAAVVDTYPKWAAMSRTVIGVGAAVYFLGLGVAVARTVRRARGLIRGGSGDNETGDGETGDGGESD